MQCARCGKKLGGFLGETGTTVLLEDGQKKVCAECYWQIKKEYGSKKLCDNCVHLKDDFCNKIKLQLRPIVTIGIEDYFVQAENCIYYMTREGYEEKAIKGQIATEEKEEKARQKEVIKEKEVIVKIRCPYCHNLYDETFDKCPYCGGRR
jgi:hypothetical protein